MKTKQFLYRHVNELCKCQRWFNNPKGMWKASEYIIKAIGIQPDRTQLDTVTESTYKTLIYSMYPERKKTIIFGAHYDAVSGVDGADDNATGVAILIELTKACFTNKSQKQDYGYEFVFFALEECPYFRYSSDKYAKQLTKKHNISDIIFINLDMVGYFLKAPHTQQSPSTEQYPNKGDFICITADIKHNPEIINKLTSTLKGLKTFFHTSKEDCYAIDLSDNSSFNQCGFDSLILNDTAFLRQGSGYHSINDMIELLDFHIMVNILNSLKNFL